MDLLSDALAIVRLRGAVIFRVEVDGPWCVRADPSLENFAGALPRGTNHIVAFHIVLAGECWLRSALDDWVVGRPGDAIVLPHGQTHDIGDHPDDAPIGFEEVLGNRSLTDLREVQFETGAEPHVELLCGFLGCDRRTFSPLFSALPSMFVTRLHESASGLVRYALDEALANAPGTAGLRVRMAELMFLESLRGFMRTLPDDATGWLAGLHDPVVGKALRLMHEEPDEDWTVESLADGVACSRSLLADRFKALIGEGPIHYFTRLRMQYAARRLSESRCSVSVVADEVGYASPEAFQRAFKRCFGIPPAAWRRQNSDGRVPATWLK